MCLCWVVVPDAQVEDILFGKGNAAVALWPGNSIAYSAIKPDDTTRFAKRLEEPIFCIWMPPCPAELPRKGRNHHAGALQCGVCQDEGGQHGHNCQAVSDGRCPRQGFCHEDRPSVLTGIHIVSAVEGLGFDIRMGLAPQTRYDVVTNAAGNSWIFENQMAHVLAADYTPLSAISIFVKNLAIMLDCGHRTRFPAPLTAPAHRQVIQDAAGHCGEDGPTVIKVFPGINLPQEK